jgi:hypothetical protein
MTRPRYRQVHGLRMPMGFAPEALDSCLRYAPADDDIFLVSYPKSGTTWLQYIVHLLIRGRPLAPHEALSDSFPHLEEVGAEALSDAPRPRLIKTHLAFGMAPRSPVTRYLVIARNPFDCAVSFFHHTRGFPRHYDFADGTFAEFFDCFLAGEVDFGDYFDHLESWHRVSGQDNVHFMTYETLKRDPAGSIRAVAGFLGSRAEARVSAPGELERLIEETSLPAMSRHPGRWSSPRPDWAPGFVRKGQIGDWRSLFTRGQARALLAKFDRRLTRAGIADPWPDVQRDAREYAETEGDT